MSKPQVHLPVIPPGPKSTKLIAEEAPFLAPGTQGVWQLAGLAMDRGEGARLKDVDGNWYLDFVAGICVAALGYGHKRQAQAIADQAQKLIVGSYTTEPRVSLLRRIANMTPKGFGLNKIQLYSGGAEAVESALRLARAYTKKFEVVSFWGGFHGKTGGVLGLMGSDFKAGLGPQSPGLHMVPYADCYRCPFKLSPSDCGVACVDFMREAIKKQTTQNIAAVIAEPIQGTNGNVIPPDDFLPAVKEVAKEFGALYISDEMITGFGRTGKMFGCEHSGVQPDIMTIGKGLGGGFPVTGVISSEEITRAEPWSKPSFSSSSYGGNPLASAAADATLGALVEERLVENAATVGRALLEALRPMVDKYPFVGEVRGRGLLIGLELVTDKKTKQPLSKKACEWIFREGVKRGILAMTYTSRVRINPPLVITEEQALGGAALLDEVFAEATKQNIWRS